MLGLPQSATKNDIRKAVGRTSLLLKSDQPTEFNNNPGRTDAVKKLLTAYQEFR